MSRKSRLVLILVLIAAAGFFGLVWVAKQYERAVAAQATDGAIK